MKTKTTRVQAGDTIAVGEGSQVMLVDLVTVSRNQWGEAAYTGRTSGGVYTCGTFADRPWRIVTRWEDK